MTRQSISKVKQLLFFSLCSTFAFAQETGKKDYYNLSDADSKRKVINYLLRQGYRYCDIKEFI